jgi:quercetin dioxygenase-like cupin family protein
MLKLALGAAAALLVSCGLALADDVLSSGDAVKWGPVPPMLPKGAEVAVVSGDPSGTGLYVVRARMPAGYQIPAHNHPTTEYVTVLSGTFFLGMGDKLDTGKGQALQPGGFAAAPAGMNHFAWAGTDAVIQVHGQGPFAITYVNPADDPRNEGQ